MTLRPGTHKEYHVVLSHSEIRADFKAGVTIPSTPARAFAAAQLSRSTTESKLVKYKYVCHKRHDMYKLSTMPSKLEVELAQYQRQHEAANENWCRAFLENHGNMTHYISSITLGAMKYTVETSKERNLQVKLGVGANIPIGGVVKVDAGFMEKRMVGSEDEDTIGVFSDDGMTANTKAVIFYEYEPLTNMVTDPELKESLKQAILKYLAERHKGSVSYL